MTSQALPVPLRSADDVTPEVLTSLLRRHDPGATVTAGRWRRSSEVRTAGVRSAGERSVTGKAWLVMSRPHRRFDS